MKASNRERRSIVRARTQQIRAAARIRRRGAASLTTYGIAEGLTPSEARSVAQSLRTKAKNLAIDGITCRVHAGRRMRTGRRYTPAEVARMALAYKPRKATYKAVKARLALAA